MTIREQAEEMMATLGPRATEANTIEYEAGKFSTDASDIGLKPGQWPEAIATSLGNKMDFRLIDKGEFRSIYRQGNGCIELVVFND